MAEVLAGEIVNFRCLFHLIFSPINKKMVLFLCLINDCMPFCSVLIIVFCTNSPIIEEYYISGRRDKVEFFKVDKHF